MEIKTIREIYTLEYIDKDNCNLVLGVILNSNKIDKMPQVIFQLINLQELWLNQNLITNIPDSIGNLTNLKLLSLHNNLISEIPDSIGNLTKLEKLYLGFNKIKHIPKTVVNLNCWVISLDSNKLCSLPIELANKQINLSLSESSYEDLNNLDEECKLLIIDYLNNPLLNLPIGLQVLKLYNPIIELNKIKIPFGCDLFVNGKIINI